MTLLLLKPGHWRGAQPRRVRAVVKWYGEDKRRSSEELDHEIQVSKSAARAALPVPKLSAAELEAVTRSVAAAAKHAATDRGLVAAADAALEALLRLKFKQEEDRKAAIQEARRRQAVEAILRLVSLQLLQQMREEEEAALLMLLLQ